jgi:hypothetical protein
MALNDTLTERTSDDSIGNTDAPRAYIDAGFRRDNFGNFPLSCLFWFFADNPFLGFPVGSRNHL